MISDMFNELIKEGKLNKVTLLDMLDQIKARNTTDVVIITDSKYSSIKARIEQLVS